ncbi:addiction module antidote protein, HigA family [Candidatus Pantoea varia]|uniref:Addiction module antidote protein, HigA family n=2 Tax=Pantoea TaxID=53335 RepID=A0A1I4XI90_9GAMM|nr:HigA family addiction module antitoxin [Pantoea varia]SFN25628.1 addiction module antidote protein, HigA family [Pantoea varia]
MNQATRKPTTVGDVLLYEYLEPTGLKILDLAEMLKVHRNTVSALVNNNRKLTPDMAFRLAAAFETSVEFWLNLQNSVDIWEVMHDARAQEEISRVTPLKDFLAQKENQVA